MKKYLSFLKLRFATGMQYRMASVAALTTQLIWGIDGMSGIQSSRRGDGRQDTDGLHFHCDLYLAERSAVYPF